jgi:Histidine phosphatase superfamily (branch 1)
MSKKLHATVMVWAYIESQCFNPTRFDKQRASVMSHTFKSLTSPRSLTTMVVLASSLLGANAFAQLTVYVVYHGQTDWNKDGRIQGGTDIPLNATGREQAAAMGKLLADVKVDALYVSSHQRARRAEAALKSIREKHKNDGTVVSAGHGGINPLLVSHLQGVPPQEGASAINQGNDEIYRIELPKTGAAAI